MVAALAERFDVYAPLAPGFADIAELDDIRDIHELAMLYDDLLEVLGLDAVACAGHSFGGMVAAELAAHHPPCLEAGAGGAGRALGRRLPRRRHLRHAAGAARRPRLGRPGLGHRPGGAGLSGAGVTLAERVELVKDEAYVEGMVRLVMGFTAVAKFMWPLPDKGLARRCYRITADTLVLWGAKDRLAPPEYAADFGRLIPRSRVEVLDDAGHMVTVERLAEWSSRSPPTAAESPLPEDQAGRNVAPSAVHTAAGAGSSSYSTKMHSPGHCIDDSTTTCS